MSIHGRWKLIGTSTISIFYLGIRTVGLTQFEQFCRDFVAQQ